MRADVKLRDKSLIFKRSIYYVANEFDEKDCLRWGSFDQNLWTSQRKAKQR